MANTRNFFRTNRNVCVSSKNLGDYALRVLDEGPFFSIHNSYVVIMRFVAQINKRDGKPKTLFDVLEQESIEM